MATKYLDHPACKGFKIGRESNTKDRRTTVEQLKEQRQLKKLKKKRKRGR